VCGGELLETLEARQRRAQQRRSSRIPLNPPPLSGRAAKKAEAAPAQLPRERRRRGSYHLTAW